MTESALPKLVILAGNRDALDIVTTLESWLRLGRFAGRGLRYVLPVLMLLCFEREVIVVHGRMMPLTGSQQNLFLDIFCKPFIDHGQITNWDSFRLHRVFAGLRASAI